MCQYCSGESAITASVYDVLAWATVGGETLTRASDVRVRTTAVAIDRPMRRGARRLEALLEQAGTINSSADAGAQPARWYWHVHAMWRRYCSARQGVSSVFLAGT
jgi:hypothetical protein